MSCKTYICLKRWLMFGVDFGGCCLRQGKIIVKTSWCWDGWRDFYGHHWRHSDVAKNVQKNIDCHVSFVDPFLLRVNLQKLLGYWIKLLPKSRKKEKGRHRTNIVKKCRKWHLTPHLTWTLYDMAFIYADMACHVSAYMVLGTRIAWCLIRHLWRRLLIFKDSKKDIARLWRK